jgi:nucleoside-diphosphate-sugar epimerase
LPGLIGADRTWSYAWVDDVADAHVAALEHPAPAAAYELGGENVPQMRPFEIARRVAGCRLPRRVPYWLASVIGRLEVARARLTGRMPQLTPGTVEIFRHDWPVASAEARTDLGFKVRSLEDGVAATVAALRTAAGGST